MYISDKGTKDQQMLMNAYYDLFSIKGWKPTPGDIINWLRRYKKRETHRERIRKNEHFKG